MSIKIQKLPAWRPGCVITFFEKKSTVTTLQTNTLIFCSAFCKGIPCGSFLIFRSFGSGKFNTSKTSQWWFHFRPFILNLMTAVARGCVTDERELFLTMTLRCTNHDAESIHASGKRRLGGGGIDKKGPRFCGPLVPVLGHRWCVPDSDEL